MKYRYLVVAAICAILHNVVIIGLDQLGVHYVFASFVSFALVVTTGFLLHSAFTFAVERSLAAYLRYALAMAANLPLSILALFLFHDVAGLPMSIASPVATVALVVMNYFLSAWAIVGGLPGTPAEKTRP